MNHTILTLLALCAVAPARSAPPLTPPNVVVILADDLGYGDLGCYGATRVKTPNIDRLAREGRRFTNAYTPGSVCSPTRYGLLAGRYFWRTPLHPPTMVLSPSAPLLFEPGRLTLASLFQRNGYATACIGKWHLGVGIGTSFRDKYDWTRAEIRPGPLEVGFDSFFGMAANVENQPRFYIEDRRFAGRGPGDVVTVTQPKGKPQEVLPWDEGVLWKNDRVGADIARKAVAFIERAAPAKRPFFLYFPTNIVHNPIAPGPSAIGTSACGPYGDFVQELDTHVGWLLDALERSGALGRTLILFTSDNGGVVAENERAAAQWQARQAGHAICGALRGRKASVYEGGFRVPFIVRWPGHVPPGSASDSLLCLTDVLATCAAILGDPLPPDSGEDSFDALPAWIGTPGAAVRDSVILDSCRGVFAIRSGHWKLIRHTEIPVTPGVRTFNKDPENRDQLYDLATDPAESEDVWAAQPAVVARLSRMLDEARRAGRTRR